MKSRDTSQEHPKGDASNSGQQPLDEPQAPAGNDSAGSLLAREILESSSYVRADRDAAFLQRDELRHVRLQLEYLKPELALQEHDIRSTIVLFGGARIVEPQVAQQKLQAIEELLRQHPDSEALLRKKQIADRLLAKSKYYEVARTFARIVSEAAGSSQFVIVTGGGPGIMEAGNRGAFEADHPSVGLNIELETEQAPNPYITPELCFQFRYFGLRKLHFMMRAKALVAFPGGYGTLDEIFDALCLVQTSKIEPIPIVLVGEDFWRNAFNAPYLVDEGVIAAEDVQLFQYAETAEQIWECIVNWYRGERG